MIPELLFVSWSPDLAICHLGPLALRWYSICWLIGLLLSYFIVRHIYRKVNIPDAKFEPLFLYCFIGILIGARLGHCLFYEPGYFLSSGTHIIEMLLPIRQDLYGDWHFTGYEGLASHGGIIGIITSVFIYCRKMNIKVWTVFDSVTISAPVTAFFIRIGNLMNSEIIGKPTDVPWAFIFERIDAVPRHPSQLYEALAYLAIGGILWYMWKKRPERLGTGYFFGLALTFVFTFRFFIEFTKEIQEAFEAALPIDMGQILSIPFIAVGLYLAKKGIDSVGENASPRKK